MGHFRGTFHLDRSRCQTNAESGTTFPRLQMPVRIGIYGPSPDEISDLAYRYWEERGREHGHDREDWLRAERELWKRAR